MNEENTCYLFAYFVGNGEDGLHLAWSRDGYRWEALNGGRSYLEPAVGESKLMRDPCPLRGPDGTFHLVWTTAWEESVIGYTSSPDLIHWSEQKAISVMAHEPDALNCWAPEIAYDETKQQYWIFWATTIRGRFPETEGQTESNYNHRIYATTTRDFMSFTPAHLFFDPGFNVIDATLLRAAGRFYLIFKDETLTPLRKHLHLAVSPSIEGPFTEISPPFGPSWVEGPSALCIGDEFIVYFDAYRQGHYGAMRSRDLKTWEDITSQVSFPPGARHGAAMMVPQDVVARLLNCELPLNMPMEGD
ncbi:MAG: glycoside hydrolase family 43 protein [Armatimonadota bacterium]|nr:glycoside hydrolase family 43 protein [Armatimonadota bacterium]